MAVLLKGGPPRCPLFEAIDDTREIYFGPQVTLRLPPSPPPPK